MPRYSLSLAVVIAAALTFAPAPSPAAAPISKIAILDSGIATHTEFAAGQVVAWRDFVNGAATPYDDQGHGTAVASRAAGKTLGSFPGAPLIVGKVLDSGNSTTWSRLASAIYWAADQGAAVINVSIWSGQPQPTNNLAIASAISYAASREILVVWIAGNGFLPPSTVLVGANSPQVLVVGATRADGSVSSFSQYDPEVVTYGENVPVAYRFGGTALGSGTSFAAPWASGIAAKLLAEGLPRDVDRLKWTMLHMATDRPAWTYLQEGYGILDSAAVTRGVAIARGSAPTPGPDERDAFHLAFTAARAAQTASVPAGALPPGTVF